MTTANLTGKQHLIFDFDRTLFTLHLPWDEYLEKTYRILRDYNEEFFNEHLNVSESNYDLINRFTKEFGSEARDRTLKYAKEFEVEELVGVTEHSNFTDFVRQESTNNYTFYIWSSNCVSTIKPILVEYDLLAYFKLVVGRDTVLYTKPEAEGFELITKEHSNLNKAAWLMIGDSSSDSLAAEAAEIDFFLAEN